MTTSIEILASSRPLVEAELLKRDENYIYNDYLGFQRLERELNKDDCEKIIKLFTLPYVYSVSSFYYFYEFLENEMELGDIIELFQIPDSEMVDELFNGIHLFPYAIEINLQKRTYKSPYGTILFKKKKWKEELKQHPLVVPDGITVIRNY